MKFGLYLVNKQHKGNMSSKEFITTEIIQSQSYIKNETGDTITLRNAAIAIYKRQPDGSLKLAYNLKAELSD
jgi:hypothetical protein